MKFLMALLILTQHTSNEWAHSTGLIHAIFGLGNFAVPFFFACSGFLFFSKYNSLHKEEQKTYYRHWSIRIWKMYGVWSLIYFIFIFYHWYTNGFNILQIWNWIHGAIVYTTYPTIWFLPALWVGISLCLVLIKNIKFQYSFLIILVIMFIGNSFSSYSNVVDINPVLKDINDWYKNVFVTWRNGVFNGLPYCFIGYMINKGVLIKLKIGVSFILAIIFSLAFLAEAFCITHYKLSTMSDMGFMIAPATYFIVLFLVKWNLKENKLCLFCRHLSMLIFLGQRLFLTALPGVIPSMKIWISSLPQIGIYLYFLITVLLFSIIIEQLSGKFKFLKILW